MNQMVGKELWSHIEKLARKKYSKDETWKCTMIDFLGSFSYIRLNKEGYAPVNGFVDNREVSR